MTLAQYPPLTYIFGSKSFSLSQNGSNGFHAVRRKWDLLPLRMMESHGRRRSHVAVVGMARRERTSGAERSGSQWRRHWTWRREGATGRSAGRRRKSVSGRAGGPRRLIGTRSRRLHMRRRNHRRSVRCRPRTTRRRWREAGILRTWKGYLGETILGPSRVALLGVRGPGRAFL